MEGWCAQGGSHGKGWVYLHSSLADCPGRPVVLPDLTLYGKTHAPRRNQSGVPQVVSGRRHVGILSVLSVGNYAVRIRFDDLHDSGIYSWPALRDMGDRKFSHIRKYLSRLKGAGLSRDPPTRDRSSSTSKGGSSME